MVHVFNPNTWGVRGRQMVSWIPCQPRLCSKTSSKKKKKNGKGKSSDENTWLHFDGCTSFPKCLCFPNCPVFLSHVPSWSYCILYICLYILFIFFLLFLIFKKVTTAGEKVQSACRINVNTWAAPAGCWGRDKWNPGAHHPASLAELMSSRFSDRPCLNKHSGERLRKSPSINLRPPDYTI